MTALIFKENMDLFSDEKYLFKKFKNNDKSQKNKTRINKFIRILNNFFFGNKKNNSKGCLNSISQIIENFKKSELTKKQKLIMDLYYIKKLKTKTIANLLGVKNSTIHRHMKTSRLKIMKLINYFKII